jgi:multiple sugar transport system ATP-binding protein
MIYVTHDQVEAMTLADRIVLLNNGRIEQEGAPLDLYEHPANRFVAGFLGQPKMNFIDTAVGRRSTGGFGLGVSGVPSLKLGSFKTAAKPAEGSVLVLGIRPDAIKVLARHKAGKTKGQIAVVEQLGTTTLVYVKLDGLSELITVEIPGKTAFKAGQDIWLDFDLARSHLFNASGERIQA